MKKYLIALLAFLPILSCSDDEINKPNPGEPEAEFIRAADFSFLPEIEAEGTVFYHGGQPEDAVTTLANAGCNYARIRVWKDPANAHSGLTEVKTLAQRARAAGMKIWLTVHFSDTWADPGQQATPAAWQSLSFDALKTAAQDYAAQVINQVQPDIFQVGNETNDGLLWPMGKLSDNQTQSVELFGAIAQRVRATRAETKIMLHFAGTEGSDWFFSKMTNVDYDYIGLSYYPVWHGKDVTVVGNTINALGSAYGKKVILAETAYPFTLGWDDWTNNIVGLDEQLIPGFAATPAGQKSYLQLIRGVVANSQYGIGFAYWGTEWVAFRGPEATNGSTFENQALWDFDHNALPAMDAFAE